MADEQPRHPGLVRLNLRTLCFECFGSGIRPRHYLAHVRRRWGTGVVITPCARCGALGTLGGLTPPA